MKVDAVFFDAGSTLIHPVPSVGEVYARALRDAGVPAEGAAVERAFRSAWRRLRAGRPAGSLEYGATEAEAMGWWRQVVRASFGPFGLPGDFERVFQGLWRHFARPDAWRVYDDVTPAFDALEAEGAALGLISNWDLRLAPLLDALGLAERLRWRIVSCDVGAEKPSPAIFQAALHACGLPAHRVAHVGDGLAEDAEGARAAGMLGVWLQRAGAAGSAPPGLPVVARLTELPDLLA